MSDAVFGKGTLIQRGDGGSPEVFTTIPEVRSIEGPGGPADVLDVTTHSTAGFFREKLSGLIDAGALAFQINYVPNNAQHNGTTGLLADWKNRTARNYKLIFPNVGATTFLFRGQITNFSIGAPVDNVLVCDVTITILDPPTLA